MAAARLPPGQRRRLRGLRWWDRACLALGITCLVGSWIVLVVVIWTVAAGIARTMSGLTPTPFQGWVGDVFDPGIVLVAMPFGVVLVGVFVVRDAWVRRWNAGILRDGQAGERLAGVTAASRPGLSRPTQDGSSD